MVVDEHATLDQGAVLFRIAEGAGEHVVADLDVFGVEEFARDQRGRARGRIHGVDIRDLDDVVRMSDGLRRAHAGPTGITEVFFIGRVGDDAFVDLNRDLEDAIAIGIGVGRPFFAVDDNRVLAAAAIVHRIGGRRERFAAAGREAKRHGSHGQAEGDFEASLFHNFLLGMRGMAPIEILIAAACRYRPRCRHRHKGCGR